ncbi:MAG TPA: 6-pyruvoyl-tetrahydropterin synthase-related protein [Pyrinomonadaceae bacterium]|nr:6-pyruvoyl-tetrahydropterin synthase-related protein [Pyrinomonadaceae bacterium]
MTARSLSLSATRSVASSLSPETRHLIILALVAAGTMAPMLFWGIPSNRDLSNHFRFALPFYDALRSGHFYPGWLADANHGFGDASFRFYPPALYYLLALTRTLAGNWYAATIITFSAVSAIGAVGVYFWAREFGSSEMAMWSGILYSVAPYHLNQFFQAVMLAEFAGAAVLPFAFAFTERVCRRRRKRDVAGLAAAYAVLILTHLPLAVIGSIALAVYALLRIDRKTRSATWLCLASSVALGLAASACYWTTMLIELKWIRADNLNPEPSVDYRHNFVLSSFSSESLNVWWMNILLLGTVAMFWPALALLSRTVYASGHSLTSARKQVKALAVVLLLTIFMSTPASRPLWSLIHPLQETQFPWRWLSITSMVCAILLAMAIPFWVRLANGKKRPLVMIALGTVAISLAFSAGHIVREARWLTPAQFEQTLSSIPGSPGVYQWLPVWAHDPLPNMTAAVEAGDRQFVIKSWEPERRVFQVSAGAATDARVQAFFYPHWKANAEGQALAVHPDQNGALVIALPREAATITVEFREPKRVKYATGLTLIGWVLIGGLRLKGRTRNSLPLSD